MQISFLMLGKQVIDLEEVITCSLKSEPDPRELMVEHQFESITPWMMFVSARLLKDATYMKSKLASADASLGRASRHHCSTTTVLALKTACNRFDFMLDAVTRYWIYLKRLRSSIRKSAGALFMDSFFLSAAPNWMQFRICNFVPSTSNHLITNTSSRDRASRS